MERGSLTSELRRLDPWAGRTSVRAEALAGLANGLEALLDGRAIEHEAAGSGERIVLAAGSRGAVVCVAPATTAADVAVTHSEAPEAVRALAVDVGAALSPRGSGEEGMRRAVVGLLGALDAAASAARDRAAHRLHDGPVQELTAAQLLVESAIPPPGGDFDAARIQRGVDLLRSAIVSCRQMMADLAGGRPAERVLDPGAAARDAGAPPDRR